MENLYKSKKLLQKLRPSLNSLKPYVAGKGFVEISSKYGLKPEEIVAPGPKVTEALENINPERYPDPDDLLTRLFLDSGEKAFIPTPTFSYYEIPTILAGATPQFIPRGDQFQINSLDAFVEKFLFNGIIRDYRSFRGAGEHHCGVTAGTPAENDRFFSAFRELCK